MSKNINGDADISKGEERPSSSMLRSVIIGLIFFTLFLLISLRPLMLGHWLLRSDKMPPTGPLTFVFFLIVLNAILSKTRIKFKFSKQDMLVTYMICTFGYFVADRAFVLTLPAVLAGLFQQSMLAPAKYGEFYENMSSYLVPKDTNSMRVFFRGGAGSFTSAAEWLEVLQPWFIPLVLWTVVFGAFLFLMICMITIVRRHWVDHEHLMFPMNIPVLTIIQEGDSSKSIWKNKLFYLGFLWPLVYPGYSTVSQWIPALPDLIWYYDLARVLGTSPPFDSLLARPHLHVTYFPDTVGIAYLVPMEVSFSVWFFFLIQFIPRLIFASTGHFYGPMRLPAPEFQFVYASTGFGLFSLWLIRSQLKKIIQEAIRGNSGLDDSNEPLSYRTAVIGGFAAIVFFVLFAIVALQMHWALTLGYFMILLSMILSYARFRAEAGIQWGYVGPRTTAVVTASIDKEAVDPIWGIGFFFNIEYSFGSLIGPAFEIYRLGDSERIKRRNITKVLILTFCFAAVFGFLLTMPLIFEMGIDTLASNQARIRETGLRAPFTSPDWFPRNPAAFGIGAFSIIFTVFLYYMRTQYVWWPFHPFGYVISGSPAVYMFWSGFFVGWLAKCLINRWAGPVGVRKALPLFLGMIIGNIMITIVLSLVELIRYVSMY